MEIAGRLPLLVALTGCAYAELGMHVTARDLLGELRERSSHRYVSPVLEAVVLASMGELDEAVRLYDRAVEQRAGLMAFVRIGSDLWTFSPAVRADPRFTALRKKLRLDF